MLGLPWIFFCFDPAKLLFFVEKDIATRTSTGQNNEPRTQGCRLQDSMFLARAREQSQ